VSRFPGQFLRRTELIKRSLRLDDEPKWWCREPLQLRGSPLWKSASEAGPTVRPIGRDRVIVASPNHSSWGFWRGGGWEGRRRACWKGRFLCVMPGVFRRCQTEGVASPMSLSLCFKSSYCCGEAQPRVFVGTKSSILIRGRAGIDDSRAASIEHSNGIN